MIKEIYRGVVVLAASSMPAMAAIELDTSILPVVIDQPGSYILTENITVASGNGILITSGGVTLDLGGFSIDGPIQCTQAGNGVVQSCSNHPSNPTGVLVNPPGGGAPTVTVRNGTISGFNSGIQALESGLPMDLNVAIENIHVRSNLNGVGVDSEFGTIRNVTATGNGWHGIVCTRTCNISNSSATFNGGYGVSISKGLVYQVESRRNGSGFRVASFGGVFRKVVASENLGHGIDASNSVLLNLEDSQLVANQGDGYHGNDGIAMISNVTAMFNEGHGFWFGSSTQHSACLWRLTAMGNIGSNYFPTYFGGSGSCNTTSWQQSINPPISR